MPTDPPNPLQYRSGGGDAEEDTRTMRRSVRTWLLLCVVWAVGLAVWAVYLAIIAVVVIGVLA